MVYFLPFFVVLLGAAFLGLAAGFALTAGFFVEVDFATGFEGFATFFIAGFACFTELVFADDFFGAAVFEPIKTPRTSSARSITNSLPPSCTSVPEYLP
jgi:hypothetical protein